MIDRLEILELFEEAQRLGKRHWPGAGFSRSSFSSTRLKPERPIAFVPTPLSVGRTPCRCGGSWELRAGCKLPTHVGGTRSGCTPLGAHAMKRRIAA